jgi:triosephosphate isomerase
MASAPRPLVAGNWKMNGLSSSVAELEKIIAGAKMLSGKVDLMVCPPATLVARFAAAAKGTAIAIGGQDCHALASGAFTGDIAAEMLADAGATGVIVGHSERRAYHGESDEAVKAKAQAAARAKLMAIVCVGETKEERDAGATLARIERQLDPAGLVIAYEPVWAIGTGLTPSAGDVAQVHKFIRDYLGRRASAAAGQIRLLYGGSVKASNAAELLSVANVNGALVGGASLKCEDFLGIAAAYR